VLSDFGLVPAAAIGVDVRGSSTGPRPWSVPACRRCRWRRTPARPGDHPGRGGQALRPDKVTIIASPGLASLGSWLEQLIAESTGKEGQGLIPIDRETPCSPERLRRDRLFVFLQLQAIRTARRTPSPDALARAGHPVVPRHPRGSLRSGQEFFRWEFATAWPARSWASIPSISRTSRPARPPPGADRRLRGDAARCPPRRPSSPATASACSPTRPTPPRWPGPDGPATLRRLPGGAPAPARPGRLLRPPGVPRDERVRHERAPAGHPRSRAGRQARWRPASSSARASCTRPARATRADRTRASSCS
jgi:hypothetical protein